MPIIKKIINKEEGCRPVLVNFQNGKIKSGKEANLKPSLYKSRNLKTIVAVTNDKMLYTGVIDNDSELYNNFILVHNKNTGKVRLIQVDCCTVSPFLDRRNLMDVSIASAVSSVSELNKQFGSKKTKRSTEQQERLTMNIDTVREELEKTVSAVKVDETDANYTAPTENDSVYRPKINRNASTLDQVYDIENIVPKTVLESLSNEALSIAKGADLDEYSLVSFAATNISEIVASASNETKVYKIAIFLYINYLIKFFITPTKSITKRFVACEKSVEVSNHILDNYSFISSGRRNRPLSMKDKALCSILVLAVVGMDYQVNIECLSKDFRIGIKKILETSRVLAFVPIGKNKSIITLKLPLPEPVSLKRKRK